MLRKNSSPHSGRLTEIDSYRHFFMKFSWASTSPDDVARVSEKSGILVDGPEFGVKEFGVRVRCQKSSVSKTPVTPISLDVQPRPPQSVDFTMDTSPAPNPAKGGGYGAPTPFRPAEIDHLSPTVPRVAPPRPLTVRHGRTLIWGVPHAPSIRSVESTSTPGPRVGVGCHQVVKETGPPPGLR